MAKYRIGSKAKCSVEVSGKRKIINFDYEGSNQTETIEVKVVHISYIAGDKSHPLYMVLIPEDVMGFTISNFHIYNYNLSKDLIGKSFQEIQERYLY